MQTICEKIFGDLHFPNDGLLNGLFQSNIDFNQNMSKCLTPGYAQDSKVKTAANMNLIHQFRIFFQNK